MRDRLNFRLREIQGGLSADRHMFDPPSPLKPSSYPSPPTRFFFLDSFKCQEEKTCTDSSVKFWC